MWAAHERPGEPPKGGGLRQFQLVLPPILRLLVPDVLANRSFLSTCGVDISRNAILLVNLAWSAVLYVRFLRGRGSFASVERWQTSYVPVYSAWATLVVIVFPLLFAFA